MTRVSMNVSASESLERDLDGPGEIPSQNPSIKIIYFSYLF